MTNIQEILDRFQRSKIGKCKEDQLVHYRKQKPIYEYNSNGEVIKTHYNEKILRTQGIRLATPSLITSDGRIFSKSKFEKMDDFKDWYIKRKNRISRGVQQFTKDGKFIRTFSSLTEAEKVTGTVKGNIRRSIKLSHKNPNKIYYCGGFVWKSENPLSS